MVARAVQEVQLTLTGEVAAWSAIPAGGLLPYPAKQQVRRVLTCSHRDPANSAVDGVFLIGYPFVHIRQNEGREGSNLWRPHRMLGLHQRAYQTPQFGLMGAAYRTVSRKYRRSGFGFITPHFANLAATMVHVDWHQKSRALKHARVTVHVTNFLSRLISGKLYIGEWAYRYLQSPAFARMPQYKKDAFQYCPYCPGFVLSTANHQLWECPKLATFRNNVHTMQRRLGGRHVVRNIQNLIDLIHSDSNTNIQAIMEYEIVYNALYAIWTVYTGTTIGLVQSFLQHGDGDPLQRHVDTVEDAVSSAFDTLTYKSVASLPLHAKSVARGPGLL